MSIVADSKPVYDLGTSKRFAKEIGLVRHLFEGSSYKAGGYSPNLSLDEACDFDCDIQNMILTEDSSIGSVVCLSVLEHVVNPQQALNEIFRILKIDGVAVISTPFFISYHGKAEYFSRLARGAEATDSVNSDHNSYGDFWRFTHEGLALMLSRAGFREFQIYPVDGYLIARLEVMGVYKNLSKIPILNKIISFFDKPKLGRMTSAHFVLAKK